MYAQNGRSAVKCECVEHGSTVEGVFGRHSEQLRDHRLAREAHQHGPVEQLEKFFSQEISIKRSKNGGGRIVIGFDDDKDIEQFIERFSGRLK